MLLNDLLITTLYAEYGSDSGISAIRFVCPENIREQVKEYFLNCFQKYWKTAVTHVMDDHDETEDENPCPAELYDTKDGFEADLGTLAIYYADDSYCDRDEGEEALQSALSDFRKACPSIRYYGCIEYFWSDLHGGEVVKFPVYSDKTDRDRTYPFVGEALASFETNTELFDELAEYISEPEEAEEIAENFQAYKDSFHDWDSVKQQYLAAAEDALPEAVDKVRAVFES